jgi:hypothetical protein
MLNDIKFETIYSKFQPHQSRNMAITGRNTFTRISKVYHCASILQPMTACNDKLQLGRER